MVLRLMRVPEDGLVLATFYAGIGDAIINGPIIRALSGAFGEKLAIPNSSGVELLALAADVVQVRMLPALFRKLHMLAPADAVAALCSAEIVAVLNFRRDSVVAPQAYARFAEALDRQGILHWDASNVVPLPEQTRVHTAQFGATFLRSLGIPFPHYEVAWLAPFVDSTPPPSRPGPHIGVYLGASVPIKRMVPAFWNDVLRTVAAERSVHFVLVGGVSPAEIMAASTLSGMLRAEGVSHTLLPQTSLTQLARLFRGLQGVLTGDTFALPLAEALGVPVVAVHCATDPVVYGVQRHTNRSILSSFYHNCPEKNEVGNCNGWDKGCEHVTCQRHVSASLVASAIRNVIPPGVP